MSKKGGMIVIQGDGSMFDTVKQHGVEIEQLKQADLKHEEQIREMKNNYTNLENTILKENRDTRSFFQDMMNKQWELISSKGKYEDAQNQRVYDYKKSALERWSEIFLKIVGTGGILYLLIQSFIN